MSHWRSENAGGGGLHSGSPASLRDASRSPQSSSSFERSMQGVIDAGCVIIWFLLGCLGLLGVFLAFYAPWLVVFG